MNPKLEDTIVRDFITSDSKGAAADADSLPTAEVFEDATDVEILAPVVAKRTDKTGNYRVTIPCTTDNGFEAGKSYNVVVSATVGGVAAKAVVGTFQVRARSVDDVLPTASYTAPDNSDIATILTDIVTALSDISSSAIANDILDAADGIETGLTLREAMRLMMALCVSKSSGAPNGPLVFRDYNDTKDRITMTTDASGNRTLVVRVVS